MEEQLNSNSSLRFDKRLYEQIFSSIRGNHGDFLLKKTVFCTFDEFLINVNIFDQLSFIKQFDRLSHTLLEKQLFSSFFLFNSIILLHFCGKNNEQ